MKRIVEFRLERGSSVFVELDEPTGEGPVRAGKLTDAIETAGETFEAALRKIRPAAEAVLSLVQSLGDPADEVKVEFGVKLSARAGAVLACAGADANYLVTLTWRATSQPSEKGGIPSS